MSAFLRLEAYDPLNTGLTIVDPSLTPSAQPAIVMDADWGNAAFEAQTSGPRSTLGHRSSGRQVKDRDVALKFRIYGTSKDDFATRARNLYAVCDLISRFGGRITRRSDRQTYRQHLEVLSTPGLAGPVWDQRVEFRDRGDFLFAATCAPYVSGDPMDIFDGFDTNTIADYTLDAGVAGNIAIGAGIIDAVANFTVEERLIHTALGYTYPDHQVTVVAQVGTVVTSFKVGAVIKRIDVNNYLECYVDDNGTNSRLRIDYIVANIRSNLISTNLGARLVAGATFAIRGRMERNTVFADFFLGGIPQKAIAPTTTNKGTMAGVFSDGARGRAGLSFLPQETTAAILSFDVKPYTYRAASLPDTFRLAGIPGDTKALMSVGIAVTDQPAIDFALIGWTASPPPVNLLDMGTNFGATPTGAWLVAAVTNINAASTSVALLTTQAKYGLDCLQVTAISGNANSGVQRRVYRRFWRGESYTFRMWVRSSTSTANVALKVGNAANPDVATSSNVALSTTWQLLTVTWVAGATWEDVHIGIVRVTSGAADVFQIDAEQLYWGPTAPTLPSQIEGLGGPAPFGILEAENTVQASSTLAADGSASAGFVVKQSALLVVDPNALTQDDGTGLDVALIEVWGRLRLIYNFSTMTAKARAIPMRVGADGVWTQEFGAQGRSVLTSVPLSSTRSRFIRFGTLAIPIGRDTGRVAIEARLDYVAGAVPANTGAKTAGANETDSNGTWTTPGNTVAIDAAYTFAAGTGGFSWRWKTFAFGVPGGATIIGVKVNFQSGVNLGFIGVQLSPDAGTSRTAQKLINLAAAGTGYVVGSSTDLWGRTWIDTEFSDANFRLILQDNNQLADVDQITVTVYYTTATDVPQVDQVILVPARSRAVTATAKDPTTTHWIPSSTGVDLEKVISPDLSGVLGFGAASHDSGGMFPATGLGGALLEIPAPNTDVLVKLSDFIPDAPTRNDSSETLNPIATVHFAITPRWAILRDV